MTDRTGVRVKAVSFNGYHDNWGFDQPNEFSQYLGRPTESWCGDFYTAVPKMAGVPLDSMQPYCRTGFAYVPDAVDIARSHDAWIHSWQAQVADAICFDWNGDGAADHVEMMTGRNGEYLFTIGGNSGPSNVDGYHGVGGVHRHVWYDPVGSGNSLILGAINISHFCHFSTTPTPPKPPPPGTCPYRLLMLKTPLMHGSDVLDVQKALDDRRFNLVKDGYYGPATRGAVMEFQGQRGLSVDGIVGCHTRQALGLPS